MIDQTVLIIEDDATMLRGLKDNFEFEGYRVFTASDGQADHNSAVAESPDLIILDIMLTKLNGYEVRRSLRQQHMDLPIIMLTAKGQESDVVLGLDVGTDDYMTKPFGIAELLARARAFLRRRSGDCHLHWFDAFELNLQSHQLQRDGKKITLTPKEFEMLTCLARHAGREITRKELLSRVWGEHVFVTPRSIDGCINTLRKKIELNPSRPQFILIVREIGYRFTSGGVESGLDE